MPDAPFILVGNKLDLKDKVPADYVEMKYGQELIDENNGHAHFQCSAKDESMPGCKTKTVEEIFKQAIVCCVKGTMRPPTPRPEPPCCFLF